MSPPLNYTTVLVTAVMTATLLFLTNHVFHNREAAHTSTEKFEKLPLRTNKRAHVSALTAYQMQQQQRQQGTSILQPLSDQISLSPSASSTTPTFTPTRNSKLATAQKRQQQQQRKPPAATATAPLLPLAASSSSPNSSSSSSSAAAAAATSLSAAAAAAVSPASLPEGLQCPSSVSEAYKVPDALDGKKDLAWCRAMKSTHQVMLGRSWGSLPRDKQREWDKSKCNEQLVTGKLQSCEERWGWSYFNSWLNSAHTLVSGQSTVVCGSDIKTATFCKYSNVVVDFGKVTINGASRLFQHGFLTIYGQISTSASFPNIPGRAHVDVPVGQTREQHCTTTETRPVFVMSNDDIYNLCHYFNDVMTVWNMVTLAGVNSKNALFINFDGIRQGGPAGGAAHRLMHWDRPDEHGPFGLYYDSWFQEVKKATDYGNQRVCFKEIYFQPFPGVPWIWNDWSAINECSIKSPSPLYQSFQRFLLQRWAEVRGPASLPAPVAGDVVHVVVEMRPPNKKKGAASICRYIPNMNQLLNEIRSIPNVRVTAQNFTEISFERQVALAHSAGVYVSMHGAGTSHLYHSAVGSPNCCALVELLPDSRMNFQGIEGFGNQARMLGMHYFRYEAATGLSKVDGTYVDVDRVKKLVERAVDSVRAKPSCLHDVQDTRKRVPVLTGSLD